MQPMVLHSGVCAMIDIVLFGVKAEDASTRGSVTFCPVYKSNKFFTVGMSL